MKRVWWRLLAVLAVLSIVLIYLIQRAVPRLAGGDHEVA